MTITVNEEKKALTVRLTGRLDTTTAPEAEEKLTALLDGMKDVTLDLNGLEYISSAGLRVLMTLHKKMNGQGRMQLTGVNETVQEIFDLTGFSEILTIV